MILFISASWLYVFWWKSRIIWITFREKNRENKDSPFWHHWAPATGLWIWKMMTFCISAATYLKKLCFSLYLILATVGKEQTSSGWRLTFCVNRFNLDKSWCWNRRQKSKPEEVRSIAQVQSIPSPDPLTPMFFLFFDNESKIPFFLCQQSPSKHKPLRELYKHHHCLQCYQIAAEN